MLLATGDQVAGALLSMAIQSLGWSARSFTGAQAGVVTEIRQGVQAIKDVNPESVEHCLLRGEIAVVAGIQGATEQSEITTLGPQGSDTTAVALSAHFTRWMEFGARRISASARRRNSVTMA